METAHPGERPVDAGRDLHGAGGAGGCGGVRFGTLWYGGIFGRPASDTLIKSGRLTQR